MWSLARMMGLAGLAILLVLARFVALGQYPEVHPDEGFWACGPRNLVLHGDGLLDGRLHPFLSPATFVLLALHFLLFPPDLFTARLFSAILGALTVAVLFARARRDLAARAWLVLLLFGLSGLAVLVHRMALLEAHQLFWLVVAGVCWLAVLEGGHAPWYLAAAAGLAFGVALLVKSNSLFLLPAFFVPLLLCPGPHRLRRAAAFLLPAVLLGGGVYLALWLAWPTPFLSAFRYELAGTRFDDGGTLFHVGRFGLHPARLAASVRNFLFTDPVLVVLGLAGVVVSLRGRRPADWFFAAWLLGGLAFHLGQIYVENRYLTTLAPALAYLGARALSDLLGERPSWWRAAIVAAVLVVFAAVSLARVGRGVVRQPNADYWQVVAWMRENARREDVVIAAPRYNLSMPQRGLDFFRLLVPYAGPPRRLDDAVAETRARWVIVDDEWRQYETAESWAFLQFNGERRTRIGSVEIVEITTPE